MIKIDCSALAETSWTRSEHIPTGTLFAGRVVGINSFVSAGVFLKTDCGAFVKTDGEIWMQDTKIFDYQELEATLIVRPKC